MFNSRFVGTRPVGKNKYITVSQGKLSGMELSQLEKFLHWWTGRIAQGILVVIHFATGTVLFVFGDLYDYKTTFPMYALTMTQSGSTPPVVSLKNVGTTNGFYMIGAFEIFTGLAHLAYLIGLHLSRDRPSPLYLSQWFRWLEYAISAPVMFAIICILSGIREVYLLVALAGLISTTMSFGQFQDVLFRNNLEKYFYIQPFWEGFWPFAIAWSIVICEFFRAVLNAGRPIPSFVYAIIWVLLVLYSAFAMVQYVAIVRTRGTFEENMPARENRLKSQDGAMHILSVVSKLTLSFMTLGGTLNNS